MTTNVGNSTITNSSCSTTQTYDDYENEIERGVWMLCFSSEYELGQFERALTGTYKDIFQVSETMNISEKDSICTWKLPSNLHQLNYYIMSNVSTPR